MCAINGFTNSIVGHIDIDLMNLVNTSRGPDYTGTYKDSLVSLGHNLLSITAYQPQPYITLKNNVLLFNGEIFGTENDTQHLGSMLDYVGIDYLKQLDGSFSVAWYEKSKGSITLARDHYGTKPLFYIQTDTGLAFSSSLESLVKLTSATPDSDYFNKIITDDKLIKFQTAITYYRNIKKVLPGQFIKFDLTTNKIINKGWLFDYQLENKPIDETLIKKTIQESIEKVCYSSKRTALLLSGGLDSNVILANMNRNNMFTVSTGDINDDELLIAKLASQKFGVMNYQKYITHNTDQLKDVAVKSLYTPIYNYKCILPRYIAFETCKEHGAKVVITGAGADELFTGYYKDIELLDKTSWIEKEKLKDMLLERFNEFPIHVLGDDYINNIKFAALVVNDSENFINDAFAGSFGMEHRSPFYLQSLVKCAMSIPGIDKLKESNGISSGISKYFLRNLFKENLYDVVSNKTKKVGWSITTNSSSMEEFIDMSYRVDKLL